MKWWRHTSKRLEKMLFTFVNAYIYQRTKQQNHNFQQHVEFTLIEEIKKQATAEETRTLLKRRENFWVLKLKALYPDGLN